MSWSKLQSASSASGGGFTSTSATFGSNMTSGSTMIALVVVCGGAFTISSVKDSSSNAFVQLASFTEATGTNEVITQVWALNTPAGDVGTKPSITATCSSASNTGFNLVVQEISGLATFTTAGQIVDGTFGHLGAIGTGVANNIGPPTYSSSAANEYLLYVYGDNGTSSTITAASGYTLDPNSINTSGNVNCIITYKSSTGGTETGAMHTTADWEWSLGMLALKLASSNVNVTPTSAVVKVAATEPVPTVKVTPSSALVTITAHAPAPAIGPVVPTAAVTITAHPPGLVFAGGATVPTAGVTVTAFAPTPTLPIILPNAPQINDWTVTYTPQAADLNLYIRDAFNFMAGPPRLRVVQSTVQTGLPAGFLKPVTFQTVTEDNYSGWGASLSTGLTGVSFPATANGYQAQQPGWYQVTLMVPVAGVGGQGAVGLSLLNAGSPSGPYFMNQSNDGASPFSWSVFDEVYLAVGDCVFPWVSSPVSSGSTSLTFPASFEIVWISL